MPYISWKTKQPICWQLCPTFMYLRYDDTYVIILVSGLHVPSIDYVNNVTGIWVSYNGRTNTIRFSDKTTADYVRQSIEDADDNQSFFVMATNIIDRLREI